MVCSTCGLLTLGVLAVDQDLVRLTSGQLLHSVQGCSVEPMDARALLGQQQVREVAVEQHLRGSTDKSRQSAGH